MSKMYDNIKTDKNPTAIIDYLCEIVYWLLAYKWRTRDAYGWVGWLQIWAIVLQLIFLSTFLALLVYWYLLLRRFPNHCVNRFLLSMLSKYWYLLIQPSNSSRSLSSFSAMRFQPLKLSSKGARNFAYIKDLSNRWVTFEGPTVICCVDTFWRIFLNLSLFQTKMVCTAM